MMVCFYCKEEKEISEFSPRSDSPGKYRSVCKCCKNDKQRDNYYKRKAANPFVFRSQKIKFAAQRKGIPYNLTPEFLKGIWTGLCPVSGEEIFIPTEPGLRTDPNAAELDRFVPERGYVKGNVTWISRKYNMKKQNSTLDELRSLVRWMESSTPRQEAHATIEKQKQVPWNKGRRTPGSTKSGEQNQSSVLTEAKVRSILIEYTGARGQLTSLAKKHNVSPASIRKIVKRQTWKHVEIER
tara:strand:- start:182 stop:901 length:720 start_codon:yes stop_codon:yes gene_type:complete